MVNNILLIVLILLILYLFSFSIYNKYKKREGWWNATKKFFVETVPQTAEDIVEDAVDTFDWFLGPGKDLINEIGDLPDDIAEGVKKLKTITDKIADFTDDIEDAFNEVGELTNFPVKYANDFSNEASNIINIIESEAKDASNVLKDSVMVSVNVIQESIITLSNEALNMISDIFTRLGEIISELFFIVLNTLKTVFESFGEDISYGFNEYFVKPLSEFFDLLGELFLSVFGQITIIANWIIHLPYCVPFYIFDTIKDELRDIIPYPILFIFDLFFTYIIVPIFSVIKYIFSLVGFNFLFKKINCYPWK